MPFTQKMLVKKTLWRCTSLCCLPLTVFIIIPSKAESFNSRAYILQSTCFTREQVDNTFTVTIKFVIYFVTLLCNKTLKNVCIVNIQTSLILDNSKILFTNFFGFLNSEMIKAINLVGESFSNFRISGQQLTGKNCHISRTSYNIDMKLEIVTKLDKRNTSTSEEI